MTVGIEYDQLCGACARDRNLELLHHAKCDTCDSTTLVGITRAVAKKVFLGDYD